MSSISTTLTPPPVLAATPYAATASATSSSSFMIVIIIIASAVIISASIYLLLRIVSKRFRRAFSSADDVVSFSHPHSRVAPNDLIDSLPLFTFRSVAARSLNNGGDCAVCLSKFEPHDQLRLLPLCCHAFHAACIDKWIVTNQTCPLCRSTVLPWASAAPDKIPTPENRGNLNSGGSFRIELGSISLRRGEAAAEGARRTYSLGSFDYIVDDYVYEVAVGCVTHSREYSDNKESSVGVPRPEAVAEEVTGRRSWLREYVASMSSRTMSFRSSGRWFTGSSRRSEAAVVPEDLEANRAGEEISELFRWISGI